MKKRVGFVGWRGMVGSVLLERMKVEEDFLNIEVFFLSTSQYGNVINILNKKHFIESSYDIEILNSLDIILTCQGSEYTKFIYPKLLACGWKGYWIDASSALRSKANSIIVLDPINSDLINYGLDKGIKNFIGGNCTVSLMLMALGGLFTNNLVEWISVSTYQAVSGSGVKCVLELLSQMGFVSNYIFNDMKESVSVTNIMHKALKCIGKDNLPDLNLKAPLISNVIPWIDDAMVNGQSREEWKMQFETNKILNSSKNISIDGTCVRVGALRSHSQSFIIKLKQDISLKTIEEIIQSHNLWVDVIPNNFEDSIKKLTPVAVSETLNIPIGRIKKLSMGKKFISAFSVGDQLLWGAAEPLRRMLNLLINYI
ncbi:aspartate-semialdehyde dehydrogenase [Buchnera aphidicola (Mollitrichosiphum nigrofasciatum)]|uniref:aspartate-semialdehyde dehydrogenase n=1 Tax=Buchnera aphidicola TaxID=9 RepID=UPI0031B80EA0